jgi:sugar phosphate isomerase/epimerase
MKLGFNLLLWTTHLAPDLRPTLQALKAAGYDGVEVPIFQGTPTQYRQIKTMLDDIGLQSTVVAIVPDDVRNPLSAVNEGAGVTYLKRLVDCAVTAAKAAGYNGWLTVEAFGHALPDIAAATRVWRPLFTSQTEVYTQAIALMRRGLMQEPSHAH